MSADWLLQQKGVKNIVDKRGQTLRFRTDLKVKRRGGGRGKELNT
jgi:hypothetical protein